MLRRITCFLVGVVVYGLFLATVLYAVGFVGNVVVTKAIDTGAVVPWPQALAIDVTLIALFGVQHSVMARPAFKRAWRRVVPVPLERSAYVLLSSACLFVLFWCWRPLPAPADNAEAWSAARVKENGFTCRLHSFPQLPEPPPRCSGTRRTGRCCRS